ncbi:nucleotide exchange factor GrpE [Actinoplanes awajinensis]|uniref:Protein GrpE n=1 Tax=Actinoplanes awajinensis subsp. mycoplanecinus TaxID=135947 RepID=A0A124G9P2_9ACTN|nr:nucleotide exchange factor GrpE [Actinoplanes awajinensis]KUL29682.1 molecular chaperone GrpE [Actinoplanes awajinensis subsp. mycoplanecinus]
MTSAQHHARPHDADAADTAAQARVPADADTAPGGTRAEPDPRDAGPTIAQLEDRWRRTVAELDNLRKRFKRQLAEQARAERARTTAVFLPVLDNLELALRHADADPASIVTGVRAVHAQAVDALAGLGFQRIDTAGVRFDPARHEAAGSIPATDGVQPGTVTDVHRAGYAAGDGTLVRPAVVTVAQAPEHQQPTAAAERDEQDS